MAESDQLFARFGKTCEPGEVLFREGEQGELIKGVFGESEQKVFHDEMRAWAERTGTTVYFFEAFDEKWKGGPHPNEVEKHWGLYFSDRTPKEAMKDR